MLGISAGNIEFRYLIVASVLLSAIFVSFKMFRLIPAVLLFILGAQLFISAYHQQGLEDYQDQKVQIIGIVAEEPEAKTDRTNIIIKTQTINGQTVHSRLILVLPIYAKYSFGDKLSVLGKISTPQALPGEFSYSDYLRRFGIFGVINYPTVEFLQAGQGNKIKSAILNIKKSFDAKMNRLPEPESTFLKGILIGEKEGFSKEMLNQFSITGTSHLIAVSGFNITIIAYALSQVLSRFGRRLTFVGSVVAIIVFVILTGASASVVRAGIMGGMFLLAQNVGRLYGITNALFLTAVIMLAQNPMILKFDAGFQLSFLALMGLVYLSPIIERLSRNKYKFISQFFIPTISAQIATLPLISATFGRISLIAPITNLLILPAIPIVMLLGFVALVASFFLPFFSAVVFFPVWFLLALILKIIYLSSQIQLAAISLKFSATVVTVYYSLLTIVIYLFHNQKEILKLWKLKPKN